MEYLAALPFLVFLMLLLFAKIKQKLQSMLRASPRRLFICVVAANIYCLFALWRAQSASLFLVGVILIYSLVPTAIVFWGRQSRMASLFDFAAILALWLPIEFCAYCLILVSADSRSNIDIIHSLVYGLAVFLAAVLFLVFRGMGGMKINLPRKSSDALNIAVGFVLSVIILIPLALFLGFMKIKDVSGFSLSGAITAFAVIAIAIALPEEILFRSLIQNCLVCRINSTGVAIFAAALIFGASHLNNYPGFPNISYMIVATVAGVIYGRVFYRSSSVFSPVVLYAAVNTVKHTFFG